MTVKQRVVEVLVWDCGDPDHRHVKRDVAERCAEKQSSPARKSRRRTSDDHLQALLWRRRGDTFKAIGERLGVSATQGRAIAYKAQRLARQGNLQGITTLIVLDPDGELEFVVFADTLDKIDEYSYYPAGHPPNSRYLPRQRISFGDWERMRAERIANGISSHA